MKPKFNLTKLNTIDIIILEKIISKAKTRFSRQEITEHLHSNGFEGITQQYFSVEIKKLINLGLIIEEGSKPKAYTANPDASEQLIYYTLAFRALEGKTWKR